MAQAVELSWNGPLAGLVVTRYGHAAPAGMSRSSRRRTRCPTRPGSRAAARMLALVSDLTSDDLVLALISGGGSALATLPAPGLTLADKQAVNTALLGPGRRSRR